MDIAQLVSFDVPALGFEVRNLASNQLLASRRDCDLAQQDRHVIAWRRLRGRNNFKRDCQQRVSSEHGDAVAEDFVTRGTPAPEIIVIHAREIIVHQRVSVDAFQRAGEGKGILHFPPASFSCREAKNRSQSFAAGEQAVAHRLVKCFWFGVRFRQIAIKRVVDFFLPGSEIRFQIHFDLDVDCSGPR